LNIVHGGCHHTRLEEALASLRPNLGGGMRRNHGSQRGNSLSTHSSSSQDDESLRRRRRPPRQTTYDLRDMKFGLLSLTVT